MNFEPRLFNIDNSLEELIGKKLIDFKYKDITDFDELTTNQNIDIIPFEVQLLFENNNNIFFSWDSPENLRQYVINIFAETSFDNSNFTYNYQSKFWNDLFNKKFISFEIYGVIIESKKEPHLVKLNFEDSKSLSIGNFYDENDFIPKFELGDDIWIFFDEKDVQKIIKEFEFIALNKF
ncbi:hypothetical protein [Empedobacter brevis]|uniref:hypothetical protein n=1 Tax=Empedobacter brevis TaxID=247 RepID=UPI0028995C3A|nr:hypothetical protein [Empedobacter brevis]